MLRAEGPGQREAGENLLVWLDLKEQNQVGGSAPPEQGGLPPSEDILDGGVNKHQEAAEVCSSAEGVLLQVVGCSISTHAFQAFMRAANA